MLPVLAETVTWPEVGLALVAVIGTFVTGYVWTRKRTVAGAVDHEKVETGVLVDENKWLREQLEDMVRRIDTLEQRYEAKIRLLEEKCEQIRLERHRAREAEQALTWQNTIQQKEIDQLTTGIGRLTGELIEARAEIKSRGAQ